ncbi:MAG: hypothetical protein IKP65_01905 [Alphaproteobacteria bacterium]|nr:hypothetical protein [Alphaproteobacteria bacterium]
MYAGCLTNEDNIYFNSSKKQLLDFVDNLVKFKKPQLEVLQVFDDDKDPEYKEPLFIAQYCNGNWDIIKNFDNLLNVYAVTFELKRSKKRFINSIIEAENKSEVFNILTEKHGKNLIGIKEINKIC